MRCAGTLERQFAVTLDGVYLSLFAFERRWSIVLSEYIWKSYCGVCNENAVLACACARFWWVIASSSVGSAEFVLNGCPEQPSECPQKLRAVSDLH